METINLITDFVFTIMAVALFVYLVLGTYVVYRSGKVLRFRDRIRNLESIREYEALTQGLYFKNRRLTARYSYDDMLYSIKPLKLEKWFNEEEIRYLTIPNER